MKVISFNVNSVRMRAHQLENLIEKHAPDVIGLQETKVTDEDFPVEHYRSLGYEPVFYGQKTHYGVALLSRLPIINSMTGLPQEDDSAQRRYVEATVDFNGTEVVVGNGYFPQGENREHPEKFPNKANFYRNLNEHLDNSYSSDQPLIIMGDMNISHQDIDIGIGEDNRKRWLRTGKCSFLPEEREWLDKLLGWGLSDTYRDKYPEETLYSWFDYRSKGFEREPKRGLRIDLILASKALADKVVDAGIDYDVRGMTKPSDHCPIWTEFSL